MAEAATNFTDQDTLNLLTERLSEERGVNLQEHLEPVEAFISKHQTILTNIDKYGVSIKSLTGHFEEDIPTSTSLDLDINSVLKSLTYKGSGAIVKKDNPEGYSIAGIEIKDNTAVAKH